MVMKPFYFIILIVTFHLPCASQTYKISENSALKFKALHFDGLLGKQKVSLTILIRNKGELFEVEGYYFYWKFRKSIKLTGKLSGNNFSLYELNAEDSVAHLSLEFMFKESENRYSLNGSWTSLGESSNSYKMTLISDEVLKWWKEIRILNESLMVEWNYLKYESTCIKYSSGYPVIYTSNASYKIDVINNSLSHPNTFMRFVKNSGLDSCNEEIWYDLDTKLGDENYNECLGIEEEAGLTIHFDNFLCYKHSEWNNCGGAHPTGYYGYRSFDLKTGDEVKLENLFNTTTNYLDFLSGYCKKELIKRNELPTDNTIIDMEDIVSGTAPKLENFSMFKFSNEALIVIIPYYNIGRSWANRFDEDIEIDWKKLKPFLNKKYYRVLFKD
jgi:hypothetical protein